MSSQPSQSNLSEMKRQLQQVPRDTPSRRMLLAGLLSVYNFSIRAPDKSDQDRFHEWSDKAAKTLDIQDARADSESESQSSIGKQVSEFRTERGLHVRLRQH